VVPEPKLPPSLNRPWGAATVDESEKDARRRKVEEAMRALPLADPAKTQISQLLSLFEMTYYGVNARKDDLPASAALVERQLSDMVRNCNKLVTDLMAMHRDAISAWASAGSATSRTDVATNFLTLLLLVDTGADWAERALTTTKLERRAAKRGCPGDAMAANMRDSAAFVYTRLTGRRAGRAYDAYKEEERDTAFIKFLGRIYEAYGVKASARSRARQRRRHMGNNSKK
jgi:hypothetical protein